MSIDARSGRDQGSNTDRGNVAVPVNAYGVDLLQSAIVVQVLTPLQHLHPLSLSLHQTRFSHIFHYSWNSKLLLTLSRAPSPRQALGSAGRDDIVGAIHERKKSVAMTETPCSLSPSSDERPRSRTASHLSRPHSQHSRAGKACKKNVFG